MHTDFQGLALTGATATTAAAFDRALDDVAGLAGDPLGAAEAIIAAEPGFAMPRLLAASLYLLGGEATGPAQAASLLAPLTGMQLTAREAAHADALAMLGQGRMTDAAVALAALSRDCPHDLLALTVGHQLDFFRGDAPMLRDRIAAALPAWAPDRPGRHALLGMLAFGLEENADYAAAETMGREAVALAPHNAWAWHAVAHVLEMQGRTEAGIDWLRADPAAWAGGILAVHNWWHLALYHLELNEVDAVLALVDARLLHDGPTAMLDLVDQAAMLWRLKLRGVELGARWDRVADGFDAVLVPGWYAFSDLHAAMANLGAGRVAQAQALLAAQDAAIARGGDAGFFAAEIGRPAIAGCIALAAGRPTEAVAQLRRLPAIAHRFGGSNAQRDVLALTLIEAALRADARDLAQTLAARRLAAKPASPLAQLLAGRARAMA